MAVLYDYKCVMCGNRWEEFAKVGSTETFACPECGEQGLRAFSPPVTDCYSFGRNGYANRTPDYARKSYYDEDERKRHAAKRELGITSKLVPKG